MNRSQKNLRQIDLEELTQGSLKQPAVSAAERGETRLAVDTLVEYCNAIRIRPDTVLEPFLNTKSEPDSADAIIDPYVVQMAEIMADCDADRKILLLQIAQVIRQNSL